MRLIINAIPALGSESGIGNYTRHIGAAALANGLDATFFYGYPSKKLVSPPERGGNSWQQRMGALIRKGRLVRALAKRTLAAVNKLASIIRPLAWDCYFEPNFVLLPSIRAECKIITVHDFSCFLNPQWHPADRVAHMESHLPDSVAAASHIITGSEAIRQEALARFGLSPRRVTAIPHGVDHSIFRPVSADAIAALRRRRHLPEHFVLYVGALEPRKNLLNLISAHAALPLHLRQRFPLLLIGAQGWNNAPIMDKIAQNAPYVRLIGHVYLQDLPVFYCAADLFAYVSFYEGFGLPVLEAMACGRPSLISDAGALLELAGDTARHVPAQDVDSMAACLRELLEDANLRQQLGAAALKRAQAYDWSASGAAHLDIFSQFALGAASPC